MKIKGFLQTLSKACNVSTFTVKDRHAYEQNIKSQIKMQELQFSISLRGDKKGINMFQNLTIIGTNSNYLEPTRILPGFKDLIQEKFEGCPISSSYVE